MRGIGTILVILIVVLISMIFMQGCIRSSYEVEKEKCDEYRETYAMIACYKFKASYLAASGMKKEAIDTCKEIKSKLGGGCSISSVINPRNLLTGETYSDCIKRVAYYSEDENVCDNIELECKDVSIGLIRKIFTKIIASGPKFSEIEIEACKKKVEGKRELDVDILDNYKYIGFSP